MEKLTNYKITKYIYAGEAVIIYAAITDDNRKVVMKVSQKMYGEYLKREE